MASMGNPEKLTFEKSSVLGGCDGSMMPKMYSGDV